MWLTEGGTIGRTSQNTNKTEDHGPMQINTVWIKRLNKDFGITREMITNDFCWNVMSAAYILRYEINLAGGSIWDGIGHYHSRTPKYKYPYIQRVYKNSLRF
ncbi:Conjugative transfer protein TrbN [Acinetobacter junii CIP 107470 = MTCC 11364]|uniref:Conjugative transfer protein TrbN n=1 Tax=Acinetobacter junii CIP 107470 = MTCC 11364 TaxID=1217666 RepID=S7WUP3_ACIJU|nr:Conjugative transfer protein TrbN [Acinetobacter junii CIP 107470 = MTCC 11364]